MPTTWTPLDQLIRPKHPLRRLRLAINGLIDSHGQKLTERQAIGILSARIERLEEELAMRRVICDRCDRIVIDGAFFFVRFQHREEKHCRDCFVFTVVDPTPGEIKPLLLARRLVQLGVPRNDPDFFAHVCEYMDCGDEGDEDFVDMHRLVQNCTP